MGIHDQFIRNGLLFWVAYLMTTRFVWGQLVIDRKNWHVKEDCSRAHLFHRSFSTFSLTWWSQMSIDLVAGFLVNLSERITHGSLMMPFYFATLKSRPKTFCNTWKWCVHVWDSNQMYLFCPDRYPMWNCTMRCCHKSRNSNTSESALIMMVSNGKEPARPWWMSYLALLYLNKLSNRLSIWCHITFISKIISQLSKGNLTRNNRKRKNLLWWFH